MTLTLFSGVWGKMIHEKKPEAKISWHCPCKEQYKYFSFKYALVNPELGPDNQNFNDSRHVPWNQQPITNNRHSAIVKQQRRTTNNRHHASANTGQSATTTTTNNERSTTATDHHHSFINEHTDIF
jgi:hypothetical protein